MADTLGPEKRSRRLWISRWPIQRNDKCNQSVRSRTDRGKLQALLLAAQIYLNFLKDVCFLSSTNICFHSVLIAESVSYVGYSKDNDKAHRISSTLSIKRLLVHINRQKLFPVLFIEMHNIEFGLNWIASRNKWTLYISRCTLHLLGRELCIKAETRLYFAHSEVGSCPGTFWKAKNGKMEGRKHSFLIL